MVTKDLSSRRKLRKFFKIFFFEKCDFRLKNMKKTESQKMTSNVLHELLIRSYERFNYFSQTWNLTIAKNTKENQRKSKNHEELNFNRGKIQKM